MEEFKKGAAQFHGNVTQRADRSGTGDIGTDVSYNNSKKSQQAVWFFLPHLNIRAKLF